MKTKFFSFFAASAMMLFAASCSSTDVEESLLPEESVNGECVTVSLDIPANDMPMSRAVPAGWELRCVVWLVNLSERGGNPIYNVTPPENEIKAIMQVSSMPYAPENTLKFTGVAPGEYRICAFCGYFKEGVETLESKAPYTGFDLIGTRDVDGIDNPKCDFFVEMVSAYKDAANSDNDMINYNNDLYDCWKGIFELKKEAANAKVSLKLKRAVSRVQFDHSTTEFGNKDLASLKFGTVGNYGCGINIWGEDAWSISEITSGVPENASFEYEVTDWSMAVADNNLVTMYMPLQAGECSFKMVPKANEQLLANDDFDYFKEVTLKGLKFDKVNYLYQVKGDFLADCGTKVTVGATIETDFSGTNTYNPGAGFLLSYDIPYF